MREWGVRCVLSLAVAALGYVGVVQSLAYALRGSDPVQAYRLAPWDGRISVALAQMLSGPDATLEARQRADILLRTAIRQDATAPGAATTLGMNLQILGDDRGGRRLVEDAETLSRRDVPAQFWLIEDAVGRGNIAAALRHYDIALRTWSKAADSLFPVLAAALADPNIRHALAKTLLGRPPWADAFVEYAAAKSADPRPAAALLEEIGVARYPVSDISQSLLVDTLASKGMIEDAWHFFSSFRPGTDRRRSRDPAFNEAVTHPTLFDWRPNTDGAATASIQRGMLDFSSPSSVGGSLVEQTQLLPAGSYRIAGHSIGIDQPATSLPYWRLSCRGDREIGRVEVPNSASANGSFAGRFSVPSGCPLQTLALIAQASDSPSGVSGQIDRIELVPAP